MSEEREDREEIRLEDLLEEEVPSEQEGETYKLKDLKLDEALFYIGLLAARIRKAKDPMSFAQSYAGITSQMLKLVGFEDALTQTLPGALMNPRERLILGIGIIVAGLFITPRDVSLLEGGEQG